MERTGRDEMMLDLGANATRWASRIQASHRGLEARDAPAYASRAGDLEDPNKDASLVEKSFRATADLINKHIDVRKLVRDFERVAHFLERLRAALA